MQKNTDVAFFVVLISFNLKTFQILRNKYINMNTLLLKVYCNSTFNNKLILFLNFIHVYTQLWQKY